MQIWMRELMKTWQAKKAIPQKKQHKTILRIEELEVRDVPSGVAPTYTQIPRLVVNEDSGVQTINLGTFFTDAENDALTFTVTSQSNSAGLVTPQITGSNLQLTIAPNQYGYSYFRINANDGTGNTIGAFEVLVNPVDDLVADSASTTTVDSTTINVLANDGAVDQNRLVEAANIQLFQNDTGNNATSVTATTPQKTTDFNVRAGSNRGDYNIQIGAIATNDLTEAMVLSTVRNNGRNNGESSGTDWATSNIDGDGTGLFIPNNRAGDGGEINNDIAAAAFLYSQGWIGAWANNSTGANGGANNRLFSFSPSAGLSLSAGSIRDAGGGQTQVTIPGVNSNSDGLLLVIHAKNEDNYALGRANADGSWQIFVKDNGDSGAGVEQDPIGFVYIPKNVANIVSGKIMGDGSVQSQFKSGDYTITKSGTGTFTLNIPGQSPTSGLLILSPESGGTSSANHDNVVTYEASGNSFIIQARDITGSAIGNDPVLEDVAANLAVASFAFIPFYNQLATRVSSVQSVANGANLSQNGATLTINVDGTVKYDPTTSTTIQGLAPGGSIVDTFTYTTTNLNGNTTTSTVSVTVTAPSLWYVDDAWAALSPGATITDANPIATGNQAATFGTNAFASVNAAIAAAAPGQRIVVNAGTYNEAVVLDKAVSLTFQQGDSSILSLAGTASTAEINLAAGMTLTVGDNNNTSLAAAITGSGNLRKIGAGTLTLSGVSTFTGNTIVEVGNLAAGAANTFSANSSLSLAAGTQLELSGFNQVISNLTGSGSVVNTSANNAILTIQGAAAAVFDGAINQASTGTISLIKTGTGTLALNGTNNSTGSVTVSGGTLVVGAVTALGTNPDLIVNTNGILNLNGFSYTINSMSGSGIVTNEAATSSTLTVASGVFTGAVRNGITGTLAILKTGTGTLDLNGVNQYSGGTIVSQGTLRSNVVNGFGRGSITLNDANTGANNTSLLFTSPSGGTITNAMIVANQGTGTSTIGTADGFVVTAVNTQFTGTLTLGKNVTLRAGSIDRTTFSGLITGTGNVIITSPNAPNTINRVAFAQTVVNNFVGDVFVNSGTLQIGVASTTTNQFIPDASNLIVAAGAKVNFSGASPATTPTVIPAPTETINGLSGAGTISNEQGTSYTLIVGALNGTADFSGTFGTLQSAFTLRKNGSGVQSISGASTTAVNTNIQGGTLLVTNTTGSALGTGTVTIGSAGTFGGTGTITGAVTATGTINPGLVAATGILTTGNLAFATNGSLTVDLNGETVGTQHDQVIVTGGVNLTNGQLRINAASNLTVGDSFVIIRNDGAGNVTGAFANGSTISATNDPQFQFSVITNGGDGNDVVLTVVAAPVVGVINTLDVINGQIQLLSAGGINNQYTISLSGSTFTVSDVAGAITLGDGAIAAGWDVSSGIASGTATGITLFLVQSGNGQDAILALNAGTANLTVSGSNDLAINGLIQTTGALTLSGYSLIGGAGSLTGTGGATIVGNAGTLTLGNITLNSGNLTISGMNDLLSTATGVVNAATLNLSASNSIGSGTTPFRINTNSLTAVSGGGGMNILESDDVTLFITGGSGAISVSSLTGVMTTGAAITTSGNLALSSGGEFQVGHDINSGTATILLQANTDGVGSEGLIQTAGTITSTNATAQAVTIRANTVGGGTGNIEIDYVVAGTISTATPPVLTGTGTLTVNSNGGSVLFGGTTSLNDSQRGITNGGSAPTRRLVARDYIFSASGAGGVGTDARPIQSFVPSTNTVNITAGDGGIYWTDWNNPVFLTGAVATGPGNVRVVSANVGGHNLTVNGAVTTGSGSIYLAADDDLNINAPIGGAGFSGTVYLVANRDQGNTMTLRMNAGSSITTSNTTANAVFMEAFSNNGTAAGGITVNNIKTGDGATVTVTTLSANSNGDITALSSATPAIDVGANGTINLTARPYSGTGTGIGAVGTPIVVTAGTVIANSTASTATNGSIYITGTGATAFTSTISGTGTNGGSINLATQSGTLTIAGTTTTVNGGAINLSSPTGTLINAQLGNSTTGAISFTGNATVASGVTFAPVLASTVSGNLTVASNGSLVPGSTTAKTITSNGLNAAGSNLNLTLNAPVTAGTDYDQLIVNSGAIDLTGVILNLETAGSLVVGDSFTIIQNNTGSPVTGQFVTGTSVNSSNNPSQLFSINYAGGASGNDVVVTLAQIFVENVFNVVNNTGSFGAGGGIDNFVTIEVNDGIYTITDFSPILLSSSAVLAGWDYTNEGDLTSITGPSTSVNTFSFALGDGTDVLTLRGLEDGLTVTGGGQTDDEVYLENTITPNGNVTISGVGKINSMFGAQLISPTGTLNLTASQGITLETQVQTIIATAGNDGITITEADGVNLTATTTGFGLIDVTNNFGTLTVAGNTTTAGGNISLQSRDAMVVNANINSGLGTIILRANTDGSGAEGFTQTAGTITTLDEGFNSLLISANTFDTGTGDLIIDSIDVGALLGGSATIASYNGNIIYAGTNALTTSQQGLTNGGSAPARLLSSNDITFVARGAGAVGSDLRPMQTLTRGSDLAEDAIVTAVAGTGGVYITKWGGADATLVEMSATGAGNVRYVAANVGGNGFFIFGDIKAQSGNIYIAADDDITFGGNGRAVTVGGAGFSGTVWMQANRDQGTAGQGFTMAKEASIITSNTTNVDTTTRTPTTQAVYLDISGDAGTPSRLVLGNITTGNGGRIVANAIPNGIALEAGVITSASDTNRLNAGANGVIQLTAGITASAVVDAIGTTSLPITVTGGTVVATSNYGNINVVSDSAYKVSALTTVTGSQAGLPTTTLKSTAGILTVDAATSTVNGGTINLDGNTAGVLLNATVGSATTGPINITGPLTGAAAIITGSGNVTANQATSSTFDGVISGPGGLTKVGGGVLTLNGVNLFTGPTAVNNGGLRVVGSTALADDSATTVAAGATLDGTGAVQDAVNVLGNLAVGLGSAAGQLTTGSLSFGTDGAFLVDLLGVNVNTQYDRLIVKGSVELTNAALILSNVVSLPEGTVFELINNDDTDKIIGNFDGLVEGARVAVNGEYFRISYIGGDGNDVTLTRVAAIAPRTIRINGTVAPAPDVTTSRITSIVISLEGKAGSIDPGAFSITNGIYTLTNAPGGGIIASISPDGLSIILMFDPTVVGVEFGSLSDGVWTLTSDWTKVKTTENIAGFGGETTENFRRLFGDVNGDGFVDATDETAFGSTFGLSSLDDGFNAAFDFNGDGFIDATDETAFGSRFGVGL
jgi:autotransporter-associated beta strand protein